VSSDEQSAWQDYSAGLPDWAACTDPGEPEQIQHAPHPFNGVPATGLCRCGKDYDDPAHVKACPCPRGWRTTPGDLTAAGHETSMGKLFVRLDTDPLCPLHCTRATRKA
jgi:hypothetical protein